jgi:hypothetical protein
MSRRKEGLLGIEALKSFSENSLKCFDISNYNLRMSRTLGIFAGGGILRRAPQMTLSICSANNIDSLISSNFGNSSLSLSGRRYPNNLSKRNQKSNSSNILRILEKSYSSNKPGFVDVKINKGIDVNRLKGGFMKL